MKIFQLLLLFSVVIIFSNCNDDNPTNPVDSYESVKICNQTWMKKNLDVSRYRNGDIIPQVTDSLQWANLKTGAWCYYNNDSTRGKIYGKLYNWYAVNDARGLAPKGWHVPTDEEWKELEMCLGMSKADADTAGLRGTSEGGKLKSTGTIESHDGLWYSPNTGATNSSGFSAIPAGYRYNYGIFFNIGVSGGWWSSTESSFLLPWIRYIYYNNDDIYRTSCFKAWAYSVRCVKD